MSRVLEIFETIATIPHCSGKTEALQTYIETFCKDLGCEVHSDPAGNILARKGTPSVCLQSHYDMVCIGNYENLQTLRDGNILKAKESTLGADNGIGVAMMLALLEEGKSIECLFTNDEEIGLVGAKNLELAIQSQTLLNLDSEEEGKVYIGCAGGFDLKVYIPLSDTKPEGALKRIRTVGFAGGHSGVEIDKNIPNAIKEILYFIEEGGLNLHHIQGGERHNSIPVHVEAIVSGAEELAGNEQIVVEAYEGDQKLYACERLGRLMRAFPTGVRSWNREYGIPHDSINLAIVKIENDQAVVEISARSMDNRSLKKMEVELLAFFDGYMCEVNDGYPAWKPEMTDFAKKVFDIYEEVAGKCEIGVIHAGLECAVIKDIVGKIDATSMGPNIFSPHTPREYTEIDSVLRVYEIVKKVVG